MTATTLFAPAWFGDTLVRVREDGVSPYGNKRYRLFFESGLTFDTSPGTELPGVLPVGEPVEFTLDMQRRVNEIRVVAVFEVRTSKGTRWWIADSIDHAQLIQAVAYPNDRVDSVRYAAEVPKMKRRLGHRQHAVLREMAGGRPGRAMKRSVRTSVQRSLLQHGLIARSGRGLAVTPRGRAYMLRLP